MFSTMAAANSLWMLFLARVIDGATAGNLSLAQAYIAAGEKGAALLVAHKAKDLAARLLGTFPEITSLEASLQGVLADSPAQ